MEQGAEDSGAGPRGQPMILITGAAGKTGRALIGELRQQGASLRAFVQREDQADQLRGLGVSQITLGDMLDPEAVGRAMRDIGTCYHIGPNMHPREQEMGQIAVQTAAASGVDHFVYHSVLHPHIQAMSHHWRKLRVEETLAASGLNFTILQPAAYMQNLLSQADRLTGQAALEIPYPPETQIALVDLADVAEAATRVVLEPGHEFARYELVGEGGPDQVKVAQTLSAILGRPLNLEVISVPEWTRRASEAGMDPGRVAGFAAMFNYYARSGLPGNPRQLSVLLGRSPTSLAEFAERELGSSPG